MSEVVAGRYAEALFELARDEKKVEEWREELRQAAERLGQEDVSVALNNPRVSMSDRVKLALQLLDDVSPQVRNLARLLVERRRLSIVPAVLQRYDELVDEASGTVRAEVTAAVPVDERLEEKIASELRRHLGHEVETEIRQDDSLIGGLVIRIGDRVIDNSIRTRLQQLRAALI